MWIVMLSFGVLGIVAVVAGIIWGYNRYAFYQAGAQADGLVVENIESTETIPERDSQGEVIKNRYRNVQKFVPVIEFTGPTGQKFRFSGPSNYEEPAYAAGANVKVIYDPRNPYKAEINNNGDWWSKPLIIVVAGVLLLVLTTIIILEPFSPKTDEEQVDKQSRRTRPIEHVCVTGLITDIKALDGEQAGKYALVVRAMRPGANSYEEFLSPPLPFQPAPETVGRRIEVGFDPNISSYYRVDLDSVTSETMQK